MAKKNRLTFTSFKNKLGHFIKKIDYFGHPITLSYDNDFQSINTIAGGIMTLIVAGITITYFYQQVTILLENKKGVEFSVFDFFSTDEMLENINLGEH